MGPHIPTMVTGWAHDGAVQEQIDASVEGAVESARSRLPKVESLHHCEHCDGEIPEARRQAVPGVRLCIACQQEQDEQQVKGSGGINRRGNKNSHLR